MVVTQSYIIDPKYAGLVIGKQGNGMRDLKSMPGVTNIVFNTKSPHRKHSLEVTATDIKACEGVYDLVARKIMLAQCSKDDMVTIKHEIDPKYCGLVIGKRGSNLSEIRKMLGVIKIQFDTKSSSKVHTLQVSGVDKAACEAVIMEVEKKIAMSLSVVPEVVRIFVDVEDRSLDTISLRLFGRQDDESVVTREKLLPTQERYIISSFETATLSDSLKNMKIIPDYSELTRENIVLAFKEALENHKGSSGEMFDFYVSLGKFIFTGTRASKLSRSKVTGIDGNSYLRENGLGTFFTPNLNPKCIGIVNQKLSQFQFEIVNRDCPETYTRVHLDVIDGSKITSFSATLVVDENLEAFKDGSQDPRLSKEKKMAIERIIDAKTIGEVLDISAASTSKVKQMYFKLSLNVHPDKNSHPGANEAFKKLNDAFDKCKSGSYPTSPALKIAMPPNKPEEEVPPKVVDVHTQKKRMCVITNLSDRELDVRGSLLGYEEDEAKLSGVVRNVLNSCWEKRDSEGRIASLERDIKISCIKQVSEMYRWIKEVPLSSGEESCETAIMEVKVKKLREKSWVDSNWRDCIEVDLKLDCKHDAMTGESLANEMLVMKTWAERLFSLDA